MARADELLQKIVESLRGNQDAHAVWLAGSHGRGEADEFSDLDIWIAFDDKAIGRLVEAPLAFISAITPPVMHIIEERFSPDDGVFVSTWIPVDDEFVQVDWYIVPSSTAARADDTRMLFGNVPFHFSGDPSNISDEESIAKAQDELTLAMRKMSDMVKHGQRGHFWSVANSARNADKCFNNARSFLATGNTPDFAASKPSVLSGVPPTTVREVQELAVLLLDEAGRINADMKAGLEPAIAAMRSLVETWRESGWKPPEEYYRTLPRRYMGAGMLITDAENNILLVETAYKKHFEIPGGVVEAGESPREAAHREVQEELGISIPPGRLLAFDTRSQPAPKGDAIMLLYDGGFLKDTRDIRIDGDEILQVHFVPATNLEDHCEPHMATRLRAAMQARQQQRTIEIIDGKVLD